MIPRKTPHKGPELFSDFEFTLNQNNPLYVLANKINWKLFEIEFTPLYSKGMGRPGKPIRLMAALLILKHLRDISDESVVAQFCENAYFQHFCGLSSWDNSPPCASSELVHFRNRIGRRGVELILQESIRVNQDDSDKKDLHVCLDTTVQEKNITFPTDSKLHKKIIRNCLSIAQNENIQLRQRYTRTLKKLSVDQRFRNHARNKKKAIKADRRIKIIAGRLVRELERVLPSESQYRNELELFAKVLAQKKGDSNKIYSLHEPETCCISKGKEHKKYEFGNKASIARTHDGIIVGAMSFRNEYDGHTASETLEQVRRLTNREVLTATADRGYRGATKIGNTTLFVPGKSRAGMSEYQKRKLRNIHRKRAAIEPVIGHLKQDHRMNRNFYKGIKGDEINIMLAAAAFNFKRMMRHWLSRLLSALSRIFNVLPELAWKFIQALWQNERTEMHIPFRKQLAYGGILG
jgi:IS5 family transposase